MLPQFVFVGPGGGLAQFVFVGPGGGLPQFVFVGPGGGLPQFVFVSHNLVLSGTWVGGCRPHPPTLILFSGGLYAQEPTQVRRHLPRSIFCLVRTPRSLYIQLKRLKIVSY